MDKLHGQANMYPIQYHDGLFSLETDIFMSFFLKHDLDNKLVLV